MRRSKDSLSLWWSAMTRHYKVWGTS